MVNIKQGVLCAVFVCFAIMDRTHEARACTGSPSSYSRSYPIMFCYGANYNDISGIVLGSTGQAAAESSSSETIYCPIFNGSDLDLRSSNVTMDGITVSGYMNSNGFTAQFCVEYSSGGSGVCASSSTVPGGIPGVEHVSLPIGSVVSDSSSYGTEGDAFFVVVNLGAKTSGPSYNVAWSYVTATTVCH